MGKSKVIISVVATCCVLTAIIVPCVILLPEDENSKLTDSFTLTTICLEFKPKG